LQQSSDDTSTLPPPLWHPMCPIIPNGLVNVWSQMAMELWSAYAPKLDENEEREDKFDIVI